MAAGQAQRISSDPSDATYWFLSDSTAESCWTPGALRLEDVVNTYGVRGIRSAREALPLLRYGVDSAPESTLRLLIVQSGLPEPEVNQWIRNDAGRRISMPDLQCKDRKVALEYVGEHHLLDAHQRNRDIDRDDRLRALGWTVLRFSKKHLRLENSGATISNIRGALRNSPESMKGFTRVSTRFHDWRGVPRCGLNWLYPITNISGVPE